MFTVTAHCIVITVWNNCSVCYLKHSLPCITCVRPSGAHPLHFNCPTLSNRCKSDPRVRTQYDISDSEWTLELSPEVLTSTLRVWWTLNPEAMHPYHIQRIQHLEPADMCSRLELCRWLNSNPHMIRNILFTDEVHFTRDGVNNTGNSHLWDRDYPNGTVESNFQHLFAVNVWCVVIGDQLIGPYIFLQHLTGDIYSNFCKMNCQHS